MIITLTGAKFSNYIGTIKTYSIRFAGKGVTNSDTSVDRESNTGYSTIVTLDANYELNGSITVTMGGTDITNTYVTIDDLAITIHTKITGNVVISVPTKNIVTGDEDSGSISGIAIYMTDYTKFGQSLMWYQNDENFKLMSGGTVDTKYKSQLVACDVSNYVGRDIKITANQAVIADAYYAFFLNDILWTGYAPADLPSKTAGASSMMPADRIVEKFVISTENEVTNTLTKTVPAGAKYLYFTNFNQSTINTPNVELA